MSVIIASFRVTTLVKSAFFVVVSWLAVLLSSVATHTNLLMALLVYSCNFAFSGPKIPVEFCSCQFSLDAL